jgi:hypothetical protein
MNLVILAVIAVVLIAIFVVARRGQQEREREREFRENVREVDSSLQKVNQLLGFPEGQGPRAVVVDGQMHTVSVGHADRMKNDPSYALGTLSMVEPALSSSVGSSG